jgi:hypothetical protein
VRCEACRGRGERMVQPSDDGGWNARLVNCTACGGHGVVRCLHMHAGRLCGRDAVAVIDGAGCCARAVEEVAACCAEDERLEVTT